MPRDKLRPRRVVGPVVVLAALACLTALLGASESPSWLAWSPRWLSVGVVAALGVLGAWWAQPWASRRQSDTDLEWRAVARLRRHLGRRRKLLRIGRDPGRALSLRVHPAIPLPGQGLRGGGSAVWARVSIKHRFARGPADRRLDPDLPVWVERDKGPEVYAAMRDAAERGGFVLLVGDSSVGKTRLLYEAAERVLPGWAVLAPDLGDGALVNVIAEAAFKLPRLIVWLDELHRFLDGPYLSPGSNPVTAGALRRLLDSPRPVVIVGALWPEHVRELRGTATDPETGHLRARYPAAVDVLDERRRVEITLHTFSPAERKAATALAYEDPRLAEAVADRAFNVTEVLAGAPDLIRRYEQATGDCRAVLQAAMDARRAGIHGLLTRSLLAAAARAYLTDVHADDEWFPPVLAELSRVDRGTSPLIAVPDTRRRAVDGYIAADYLLQYAMRRHRRDRIPVVAWQAFVEHAGDLKDLQRLASSAHNRLLYRIAEPAYLRLAGTAYHDAGWAACRAAEIMSGQGRTDEAITLLARAADADDRFAREELARLLVRHGRISELSRRADAADESAATHLIDLLVRDGRQQQAVDALQGWAASSDMSFARWVSETLADLLADMGDVESLRIRAIEGDYDAAHRLIGLLEDRGDFQQAIDVLQPQLDAGSQWAARMMSDLLARQGRREEAVTVLQSWLARQTAPEGGARPDTTWWRLGVDSIAAELVHQLVEQDLMDQAVNALRDNPAATDWRTERRILMHLAERKDLGTLRILADAGNAEARRPLAALLAEHGDVTELESRATAGEYWAMFYLTDILIAQGDIDRLLAMLRALADAEPTGGPTWASKQLAGLLAERGELEELRARADDGDMEAARRLADLLVERGDLAELRARAHAGDWPAGLHFIHILVQRVALDELRALADTGNEFAVKKLANLLAERGNLDQAVAVLTASIDKTRYPLLLRRRLAELLIQQRDVEGALTELRKLTRTGQDWAEDLLVDLLRERGDLAALRMLAQTDAFSAVREVLGALAAGGDIDGLRAEVDAGTPFASRYLIDLLAHTGKPGEADALYRDGLDADGSPIHS